MKYLLDTNACINALHQRQTTFTQRFLAVPETDKVVCSVSRAELYYGAYKSKWPQKSLADLQAFLQPYPNLDFDLIAARISGEIRADLARKGTPIGPYDVQIAAIALAHGLVVVTHNTREFSRIPNLNLTDWEI
ncbi:MAG: type II toxin-antitoxin system VapC family toxin [Acidobacteriota bacterium]